MKLIGKTTIHPLFFYTGKISGYVTWAILFLLLSDVNIINSYSAYYNSYIAYLLLIPGLILIVFSLINLGRSTRLGLPNDDTVFVVKGLYRFSRNPMYLGFNLLTIASMVYTLNIWVIAAGIYSIMIYHFIILGEESFLISRFGDQYANYLCKVSRYL